MAGKDYGPKGCCGPSAYGFLMLTLISLTATFHAGRKRGRSK
jgi:hypothetical protein